MIDDVAMEIASFMTEYKSIVIIFMLGKCEEKIMQHMDI